MTQQLPPGQGPIDPRNAFTPPPAPGGRGGFGPPPGAPQMPPQPPGAFMYPPPFFQPPRKRGVFKIILIICLFIGLVVSVLLNFVFLTDSISSAGNVRQTVLVAGDAANKIAVVPIDGIITDSTATQFDHVLTDVEKDSAVKALVVEIDTPGGSATSSDEMYHRLMQYKARTADKKISVTISMKGMATSGGYYVACAGDYIIAENGTLTGNIGVLMPRFNVSELMKKYGVSETTLTATTSGHSFKNAGSMFQPPDPQDEKYIQGLIDDIFAQFKDVVLTGRKGKLKDAQNDIFSGKAFIAAEAKTRGLVDTIGYPQDAYDYAAKQAGIASNELVVRYSEHVSILDVLMTQSNLPSPSASSSQNVTINGVNIDSKSIGDLITARPMLLWRSN